MKYLIASAACLALVVSACSHSDARSSSAASQTQAATRAPAATTRTARNTYAGATRTVVRSAPETLIRIPRFGSLTVSCTRSGSARTVFTVRSPASTVVVVRGTGTVARLVDPGETLAAPPGPDGAMQQVWQITPVTEAEVPVATISVASMPSPAAFGGKGCFVSAQGTTSRATG